MSRKLYEIHDAIERVLSSPDHVDRETGEILPSAWDALDALEMEREQKVLACGRYIAGEKMEARKLEAVAKEYKAEADKYMRRARGHTNRAERIRAYCEQHMNDTEKFKDERVRMGFRLIESVQVAEGAKVESWPERFRRSAPNKVELKRAMDGGEPVPDGVSLESRKKLVVT